MKGVVEGDAGQDRKYAGLRAHRTHARFGKAQAIIRHGRAGATSLVGKILACNRTEQPFVGGGRGNPAMMP
jgi:hypothetical protein